jgi:hypothetical protein
MNEADYTWLAGEATITFPPVVAVKLCVRK